MKSTMMKTKTSLLTLILLLSHCYAFCLVISRCCRYYLQLLHLRFRHRPKVVGVGQSILLVAWTADIPPDIGETAGTVPSPNGRAGWNGMQINLTKPNGESVLLDMPHSDPVGANYISYVPEAVGTYYIQAIFPETWKNTTTTKALSCCSQPHRHLHRTKRTNINPGLRHLCPQLLDSST